MKFVIQRVSHASVTVENETVGSIGKGFLVLIGVCEADTREVTGMIFSYDEEKVNAVIADTYQMEGIYYIKVWLNEGTLSMGDDIMYVLIGGDIRPRVVDALQYLVSRIKNECVVETEVYANTPG